MRVRKSVSGLMIGGCVAFAGLAISVPAMAQTTVKSISCPYASLPAATPSKTFSIDADAGTCTESLDGSHPGNGFLLVLNSTKYKNPLGSGTYPAVVTRGQFFRDGIFDSTGDFELSCEKVSECTQEHRFTDGSGREQVLKIKQSATGASVTSVVANITADVLLPGTCENVSGIYGPDKAIMASKNGKISVHSDNAGPLGYGDCSGAGSMTVDFDGLPSMTGTFDGAKIIWSDKTKWLKYSPANPLPALESPMATTASNTACSGVSGVYGSRSIVVGSDKRTVYAYFGEVGLLTGGMCSARDKVTLGFPDGRSVTGTVSGTTITWDDGALWTKN